MTMELILWLVVVQGIMGVFDLVWHHEITEKLTWKPAAASEMLLHGMRNALYAVVFVSLGFLHWHGALMWAFAAILLGHRRLVARAAQRGRGAPHVVDFRPN
jgi:uncharacterized protein